VRRISLFLERVPFFSLLCCSSSLVF
jgi:hypothetical protein